MKCSSCLTRRATPHALQRYPRTLPIKTGAVVSAPLLFTITERAYMDAQSVGHETVELCASTPEGSQHARARSRHLNPWDAVDVDDYGNLCIDVAPLEEWWCGPVQLEHAADGDQPPAGVIVRSELHALCEVGCRAPGGGHRWALRTLRDTTYALRMRRRASAEHAANEAVRCVAQQDQTEALLRDLGPCRRDSPGRPGRPRSGGH